VRARELVRAWAREPVLGWEPVPEQASALAPARGRESVPARVQGPEREPARAQDSARALELAQETELAQVSAPPPPAQTLHRPTIRRRRSGTRTSASC